MDWSDKTPTDLTIESDTVEKLEIYVTTEDMMELTEEEIDDGLERSYSPLKPSRILIPSLKIVWISDLALRHPSELIKNFSWTIKWRNYLSQMEDSQHLILMRFLSIFQN